MVFNAFAWGGAGFLIILGRILKIFEIVDPIFENVGAQVGFTRILALRGGRFERTLCAWVLQVHCVSAVWAAV